MLRQQHLQSDLRARRHLHDDVQGEREVQSGLLRGPFELRLHLHRRRAMHRGLRKGERLHEKLPAKMRREV
jgi:hypothetical protein